MLKIGNSQEIEKRSERVICYGAGKQLEKLVEYFENTEIWNKMQYVVDKDEKKQNTEIVIKGKTLNIISLDELKRRNYKNYVIIITCANYEEILWQLNSDSILQSIDYYCFTLIQYVDMEIDALQKQIPDVIKLYKEPIIPKVIHYCWFGGNPLPDKYKMWMESWRKYCPDYEIIEWNETNYDVTKNTYMCQVYKNKKWGFVPDYARLDIIYNHGGIYLDTDVELIQNIDDMLFQKGFAGFQSYFQVNFGQGFGAVKGLPIIKEMLDLYNDIYFVNRDGSLNMTPSPEWQTQILEKHGLCKNGEYQVVDGMTIYPEKVLCGKNVYTRRIILKPYTRAIHHYDGSWTDKEQRDKNVRLEKMMQLPYSDKG